MPILRRWYGLGPRHLWPYAMLPFYWLAERSPSTRESARKLGLVTVEQMLRALRGAGEHPPSGVSVIDGPRFGITFTWIETRKNLPQTVPCV